MGRGRHVRFPRSLTPDTLIPRPLAPGHKGLMQDTWALLFLTSSWMPERACTPDHHPQEKPQVPSKDVTYSPFLSKSPRYSVCICCLCTFNKLCSHFLLACVWFRSCSKPRTLWLVLKNPLWVLGPSQPASVRMAQIVGDWEAGDQ